MLGGWLGIDQWSATDGDRLPSNEVGHQVPVSTRYVSPYCIFSKQIWHHLLSEVDVALRFGEWGMAAWCLQKQALDGTPGPAIHYMALLPSENDDEFTHRLPNLMSGKIMQASHLTV